MATYRFVPAWTLAGDDERQIGLTFVAAAEADEADVEANFDALWEWLKVLYEPAISLASYTWYEGPEVSGGHIEWGDSFRVVPRSVPGTEVGAGATQLPPQVAVVVSFPLLGSNRRHSGRVYLPAPSSDRCTDTGRFNAHQYVADGFQTFFNACLTDDWLPTVAARPEGGPVVPLDIGLVRVNDTFDTQRRRGYERYIERTERTIGI